MSADCQSSFLSSQFPPPKSWLQFSLHGLSLPWLLLLVFLTPSSSHLLFPPSIALSLRFSTPSSTPHCSPDSYSPITFPPPPSSPPSHFPLPRRPHFSNPPSPQRVCSLCLLALWPLLTLLPGPHCLPALAPYCSPRTHAPELTLREPTSLLAQPMEGRDG